MSLYFLKIRLPVVGAFHDVEHLIADNGLPEILSSAENQSLLTEFGQMVGQDMSWRAEIVKELPFVFGHREIQFLGRDCSFFERHPD